MGYPVLVTTTSLGDRLAKARKRRRMSQEQLARASGVSIGLIRKIEQGQRQSARLDTVSSLSSALDVPMTDLLGVHPGLSAGGEEADVATVRAAIYDRSDDHEPVTLQTLRQNQHDMHGLYWHARYAQLAELIPNHLAAARSAVRDAKGDDARRQAQAVLAQGLKLTASLVTHLAYEDLAHVALLQARVAAEAADDPLLLASHASTTAWVLSRQGLWQQAQTLAAEAAKAIEPVFSEASPQQIAMWGQLLHFGMVALAREGRGDEAHELLSLVQAAGQAVGNRAGPRVLFSETFAAHSVVQLHQATGQPREALRAARRVETPEVLPPSVQSRFLLNKAWALTLEWKSQEALDALRKIEIITPELLNHHGLARAIVEELMPRRGKQHLPGLVGIAERIGVSG
jgi:transcriptional regulator with XRE-family HTH domain